MGFGRAYLQVDAIVALGAAVFTAWGRAVVRSSATPPPSGPAGSTGAAAEDLGAPRPASSPAAGVYPRYVVDFGWGKGYLQPSCLFMDRRRVQHCCERGRRRVGEGNHPEEAVESDKAGTSSTLSTTASSLDPGLADDDVASTSGSDAWGSPRAAPESEEAEEVQSARSALTSDSEAGSEDVAA